MNRKQFIATLLLATLYLFMPKKSLAEPDNERSLLTKNLLKDTMDMLEKQNISRPYFVVLHGSQVRGKEFFESAGVKVILSKHLYKKDFT